MSHLTGREVRQGCAMALGVIALIGGMIMLAGVIATTYNYFVKGETIFLIFLTFVLALVMFALAIASLTNKGNMT